MKKILIFVSILIPCFLCSQTNEDIQQSGFFKNNKNLFRAYGVLGGNFAQIDGDNSAGYNTIGANAGLGVFVTYSNKLSNSLEISYSMKGAKSTLVKRPNFQNLFNYQLDYIDIPLLFNYHDFKIAIFQVGLSYSQLIRSKYVRNNTNFTGTPDEPNIYNSNLDFVVGFTFLIKEKWGLNFKYNYSLLNNLKNGDKRGSLIGAQSAGKSTKNMIGGGSNWFHNVISFRVMYIIN